MVEVLEMNKEQFFQNIIAKEIPVCIYLVTGMCLTGKIVEQSLSDGFLDYIILKPIKEIDNNPFPYQYVVLNNVTTIQKLKEKVFNK